MANILFVHQNFPAQFGFLAKKLIVDGHKVCALGGRTASVLPGMGLARWTFSRGSTPGILPEATRAEADLIRAAAALQAAQKIAATGFSPDLIIGHPGWGETLYLPVLWPKTKIILYAEFFYQPFNSDTDFDPEFHNPTIIDRSRSVAKTATLNLAYTHAHHLVAPTPFQASRLPDVYASRVSIIHEGVDTDYIRPQADPRVEIRGRTFTRDRPVVTFVNRTIEPLRGSHSFFRAIPKILREAPEAEVVIVGAEAGPCYGRSPPAGQTWKDVFWKEIEPEVDDARVHFVGTIPHDQLGSLMSLSAAHVYLTYPFLLSWSLMEAMASAAYVVGSDTPPLRDVITNGVNGTLVDFFDPSAIADAVLAGVRSPDQVKGMRQAARDTIVSQYDRETVCLPQWLSLINEILA